MKISNLDEFTKKVKAGYRFDTEKTNSRSVKAEKRAEEKKIQADKAETEPFNKKHSARKAKSIKTIQDYLKKRG